MTNKRECVTCGSKTITSKTGIRCMSSCGRWYHLRCAGLTAARLRDGAPWCCADCDRAASAPPDQANISQESQPSMLHSDSESSPTLQQMTRRSIAAAGLFSVPCDLANALSELQRKVDLIMEDQQKLVRRLDAFEFKFNELPEALSTMRSLVEERDDMRRRVTQLEDRLDDMEQRSLADQLEIRGLPDDGSADPARHVQAIARFAGVELREDDLSWCTRQPSRAARGTGPPGARSSAIIVAFRNRAKRDEMLKKSRGKRPLTGKAIGLQQEAPVFVNEHLTPARKRLLARTREWARANGVRFVWVQRGDILIRKDEGSKIKRVRNDDFLKLDINIPLHV